MDFYNNNNNLFRKAFLLLITPVLFFSINIFLAQAETGVPSILSYQGRLTDSSGNLLGGAGTPYFFKFSFWDSATAGAGSQVWPVASPSPVSLTVKQGVFNVNIGDTENSYPDILNYNFGSNKNIYLQVEVSANNSSFETLSPRQRITSAPFAEVAASLAPDYLTSIFSNYFTKTESNNLYDFFGAASTTASTTIANHENIFNHNLISTALQTESDPIWSAASTTLSVNNFATSSISQWLNDSGYLTSFTETDPLFTSWDKNTGISITESQISDLKNYLTGESDTLDTITARGASTSIESIFSGGLVTNKIRPITDSSTAIQIMKADGTTSVLNIDTTNGRVGIGTTAPTHALTFSAASTGIVLHNVADQLTDTETGFMRWVGNSFQIGTGKSGTGTARGLEFFTGGVSRFTLTGAGDYSPTADNTLFMGLSSKRFHTAYFSNTINLGNGSTPEVKLLASGVSYFNGGNVGIGTSTPNSKLHIVAGYDSANQAPLVVQNTTAYGGGYNEYSQIWLDSAGAKMSWMRNDGTFYMGGSQGQMRTKSVNYQSGETAVNLSGNNISLTSKSNGNITLIPDGTGNVGIGTSTPIYPLSISATSSYNTGLSITGNINSFFQGNIQNTNSSIGASSDWVATANNGNDTTHYIDMGINNSGGGISPFTNANETYLYSASDSLNIGALGTSSIIKFYTDGNNITPAVTFDNVGNVIIGTSTDPALLTISDGISVLGYGGGQIAGIGQNGNRIGSLSLKATASTKVFLTSGGNSWISGGSLGIGTTDPTANFQVSQDTAGVGKVSVATGGTVWTGVGTEFLNTFKVGDTITSSGQTLTIESVDSDTSLTTNAVGAGFSAKAYTLSGGTRFSVLGNGNVGIGTTTPSQVLSVVGNAQFTAVGSGASANDLRITADGTLTTSASDIALKMNLIPLNISSDSVLDKVVGLKPYTYNWKSDPDGPRDIGLIAQDVENIFPEITFTNKTDGYKGINYSRLPVILISAIQELNNKLIQVGSYVVDGVASFVSVITDKFVANEADIKNIKTQQVCIGETCLDETMLKEIILKNSITDNGSNTQDLVIPPTGTSTATSTGTTTDIVASSTTETTASTTEETIPEATSTEPIVEEVAPIATTTEPII